MIDLRKTIKDRMARRGITSGYAPARLVDHKITVATIDRYLKGQSEMTSGKLEIILCALGADSVCFKNRKKKPV